MRSLMLAIVILFLVCPLDLNGCRDDRGGSRQHAEPAAPIAAPTQAAPVGNPDPAALIGKPPPPITVAKWLKGEPVTQFEKGTVYVVDFWATWCGPCKAAIPHLSALAQAHRDPENGRVEVIGVSISERQKDADDTSYIEVVQAFVAKMGDRMDYRVAADTPDKRMHASWFKPAGTGGIPTAYIIDQRGLVAWTGIGTPAVIERIVGEVLAGTFDPKKEAQRQAAQDAEAEARAKEAVAKAREAGKGTDEKFPGYREAMQKGDVAAAIESLNQAFRSTPSLEYSTGAYQWKIMSLLQRARADEVEGYLKDLMARTPGERGSDPSREQLDDMVAFYSACLCSLSDSPPRYDPRLILDATKRADAAAKAGTRWQGFTKVRLAWAQWHAGEKEQAAATMEAARDMVARLGKTHDFGDLPAEIADALKLMKGTTK